MPPEMPKIGPDANEENLDIETLKREENRINPRIVPGSDRTRPDIKVEDIE